MDTKLTGGSSDYYKVHVEHPVSGSDPYTAEALDIAEAMQMSVGHFNIFKAVWRLAAARTGNGKPGLDERYDLEKIVFFAERELTRLRRIEYNKLNATPLSKNYDLFDDKR